MRFDVDITSRLPASFKVINSLVHMVTVNTALDRVTVLALARDNLDLPDSAA